MNNYENSLYYSLEDLIYKINTFEQRQLINDNGNLREETDEEFRERIMRKYDNKLQKD